VILADGELCRQLGIKHFKVASNRSIPAFIECAQVHKDGLFFSKIYHAFSSCICPLYNQQFGHGWIAQIMELECGLKSFSQTHLHLVV
jgi:hypothetical protein